jgi:hypothetical protein
MKREFANTVSKANELCNCLVCNKPVVRKNLASHFAIHRIERSVVLPSASERSVVLPSASERSVVLPSASERSVVLPSAACGVIFRTEDELTEHLSLHRGKDYTSIEKVTYYQCVVCLRTYTNLALFRNHQRKHTDKKYSCPTCGKGYQQEKWLILHLRSHSTAQKFQCGVCLKNYRYQITLKKHICVAPSESFDVIRNEAPVPLEFV